MKEKDVADLPLWNDPETSKLFEKLCSDEGVSSSLIRDLIRLSREYGHMARAHGIYNDIDILLDSGDN